MTDPVLELIRTPDIAPLMSLWTRAFGEPAAVFSGVWAACSPANRWAAVARQDGVLLASVMVYLLDVEPRYRLAGIANVSTLPQARGQGLSAKLVDFAVNGFEQIGADFSVLYTGIPHHYAKHGYQIFEEPGCHISPSDGPSLVPNTAVALEQVQQIYDAQPRVPYRLHRTDDWWNFVVGPRLQDKLIWHDRAGYLIAEKHDQVVTILEAMGDVHYLARGAANWAGGLASRVPVSGVESTPTSSSHGGMFRAAQLSIEESRLLVTENQYLVLDHF